MIENTKMIKHTLHHHIIQNRLKLILQLIKEGRDVARIERETALLVFDIVDAIGKAGVPAKEGCQCFVRIEYALDRKIRSRMSQEFEDMVNEGMLLDEVGSPYGADLKLLTRLATGILTEGTVVDRKPRARAPVAVH